MTHNIQLFLLLFAACFILTEAQAGRFRNDQCWLLPNTNSKCSTCEETYEQCYCLCGKCNLPFRNNGVYHQLQQFFLKCLNNCGSSESTESENVSVFLKSRSLASCDCDIPDNNKDKFRPINPPPTGVSCQCPGTSWGKQEHTAACFNTFRFLVIPEEVPPSPPVTIVPYKRKRNLGTRTLRRSFHESPLNFTLTSSSQSEANTTEDRVIKKMENKPEVSFQTAYEFIDSPPEESDEELSTLLKTILVAMQFEPGSQEEVAAKILSVHATKLGERKFPLNQQEEELCDLINDYFNKTDFITKPVKVDDSSEELLKFNNTFILLFIYENNWNTALILTRNECVIFILSSNPRLRLFTGHVNDVLSIIRVFDEYYIDVETKACGVKLFHMPDVDLSSVSNPLWRNSELLLSENNKENNRTEDSKIQDSRNLAISIPLEPEKQVATYSDQHDIRSKQILSKHLYKSNIQVKFSRYSGDIRQLAIDAVLQLTDNDPQATIKIEESITFDLLTGTSSNKYIQLLDPGEYLIFSPSQNATPHFIAVAKNDDNQMVIGAITLSHQGDFPLPPIYYMGEDPENVKQGILSLASQPRSRVLIYKRHPDQLHSSD